MCKNGPTLSTKKTNFIDIILVARGEIKEVSNYKVISCGIENNRVYAMTDPRNKKNEKDLINTIEADPINAIELFKKEALSK